MLPQICICKYMTTSLDSLLIISPHRIPSTAVIIELLSETSSSICLFSTHVNSTSRITIDPSITSDLSDLSKLILRGQLACTLNMERCGVLVQLICVGRGCWVGSVPCSAIWSWEGVGAFYDIDFTSFWPSFVNDSPPCGPLLVSTADAGCRGATYGTAADWHVVQIQNVDSLYVSPAHTVRGARLTSAHSSLLDILTLSRPRPLAWTSELALIMTAPSTTLARPSLLATLSVT